MSSSWIYRRSDPSGSFRLFCFPYAGGTAAAYRSWQDDFPDHIEVCAIEPPGRRHRIREEPFRRLTELADAVLDALTADLGMPFAFFGHSLGALVAFEVARRIALGPGQRPTALFLSSAVAPQLPSSRASSAIWDLPPAQLRAELRDYGGTLPGLLDDSALLEVFLPVLRADLEAFDSYSCDAGARLDVPVYLYGGEEDPKVPAARLWAWCEIADVISVRLFPGGHFYLRDHQRALTASIARTLNSLSPAVCAA
jgi:medium-chain acyl-[acyl-carrier-protein] hydrolase